MDLLWRRIAAALVDIVLAVVACGLASAALHGASGGIVHAGAPLPAVSCVDARTVRPDVAWAAAQIDPSRAPTAAMTCTTRFMGLAVSRYALVVMSGQGGRLAIVPVNAAGEAVKAVSLGGVPVLVFILLIAGAESLARTTPGKLALGLAVGRPDGERVSFGASLVRNLLLYAWVPILFVAPQIEVLTKIPAAGRWAAAIYAGLALALLVTGRPDPLYDRWTGVRVRRAP